jgi:hypothetical protein
VHTQTLTHLHTHTHTRTRTQGFHEGKMIVGAAAGDTVENAKTIIKNLLIENNQGATYYEPENKVGVQCSV